MPFGPAQGGSSGSSLGADVDLASSEVTGVLPIANGGTSAATAGAAATALGLGTGDSPQFAAVNIGHATDTTVSRSGAGDIAVEGNALYRAGGTDVPVTDGGTGSSTAAGALTNLGALPLAGGTMTGALLFTDNTPDIGATGATRPRTLYLGTSLAVEGTNSVAYVYEVYDAANYERIKISAGAGSNAILSEKGGTGTLSLLDVGVTASNVLRFNTAAGSGAEVYGYTKFTPGSTMDASIALGALSTRWTDLFLSGLVKWTNGSGTADTGLARNAAGVVEANSGTAGTLRDLKFRTALGALAQPVDTRRRVYRPALTSSATFLLVSDTAYFCYMGFTTEAVTPKYVEFHVTTVGVGAQTAEVGLFSSTTAPNKGAMTLTKLAADGTLDDLTTGTTIKRNTSAMATAVAAGTHLWVGIRTAMATTQPTLIGCAHDFSQGAIQSTTTAGALTGAGPWTGAITASATTAIGPFLTMALD